jgi:hypothetical protein
MWWVLLAPDTRAASCPPAPLHEQVADASDTFEVTLLAKRDSGVFLVLTARVDAVYGGCAVVGEEVELLLPGDPDAQPAWDLGLTYVVTTTEVIGAQRTTDRCQLFTDASTLPAGDLVYLEGRPVTCDGVTTCQDAVYPATCDDLCLEITCPDAACFTNPCAACAVELFDAAGSPQEDEDADGVCDAADRCAGDDRADRDGDSVCDADDTCDGDDLQDSDGDGIPDACDEPATVPGTTDTSTAPPPRAGGGGGCSCSIATGPGWLAAVLSAIAWRRRARR